MIFITAGALTLKLFLCIISLNYFQPLNCDKFLSRLTNSWKCWIWSSSVYLKNIFWKQQRNYFEAVFQRDQNSLIKYSANEVRQPAEVLSRMFVGSIGNLYDIIGKAWGVVKFPKEWFMRVYSEQTCLEKQALISSQVWTLVYFTRTVWPSRKLSQNSVFLWFLTQRPDVEKKCLEIKNISETNSDPESLPTRIVGFFLVLRGIKVLWCVMEWHIKCLVLDVFHDPHGEIFSESC